MRPFLLLVLLIASLLALLAPAQAADGEVELPGEFMGMVTRDPHYEWQTNSNFPGSNEAFYDAMGENLRLAGVKWVRIEFRAEDPGSDMAGRVRLEQYAYFVNSVAPRYGFKVLALLATPLAKWPEGQAPEGELVGDYIEPKDPKYGIEAGATDGSCFPYGCGTNQYMRIWLKNAFEIAQRFPYDRATGAGIAAYEVMNEENRFLNGDGNGISPQQIGVLVTKFYRIFKQQGGPDGTLGNWRNDVQIILGGIHPGQCEQCDRDDPTVTLNDRQYLNAIYQSAAFRNYRDDPNNSLKAYPIDGVGYHPYPLEIRPGLLPNEETARPALGRVPERIRAMRRVMVDNGDTRNAIWVTEIGDRGAPQYLDNQRRQGDFLRTIYWMMWQQRAYVKHVFWFKYEDFAVPTDPNEPGPERENWGVVRLLPRDPKDCPDCDYDPAGVVQVYKQSFVVYAKMSRYGTGLQSYRVYVPTVSHSTNP